MKRNITIFVILTIWVLSACSPSSTPMPTGDGPTPYPIATSPENANPYPYPYPQPQQPYIHTPPYPIDDSPVRSTDQPFVVPTADADSAVLFGRILDEDTGLPMVDQSIYLGEKIMMTPGPGYSVGVQEKSSPHTLTNGNGQFVISDIPPGTYVLMVWTPFATSFVIDPKTQEVYELTFTAGQSVDLGVLEATDPTKK
jgi:hypothetical protein